MPYPNQDDRVGLVLSGGGARGFAHLGVLRVLEEADIHPNYIIGTSIGAVLGAFYAHGYSPQEINEIANDTAWTNVFDLSLETGLFEGSVLHDTLANYLPAHFEDLRRPFAVTATDIEAGEQVIIDQGELVSAVRAACTFPGMFEPVKRQGRLLFDGGVISNLPLVALHQADVSYTIASNAAAPRRKSYEKADASWWQRLTGLVSSDERHALTETVVRAISIMQRVIIDMQYEDYPVDLLIHHDLADIKTEDFSLIDDIVTWGEQNARAALTGLRIHE